MNYLNSDTNPIIPVDLNISSPDKPASKEEEVNTKTKRIGKENLIENENIHNVKTEKIEKIKKRPLEAEYLQALQAENMDSSEFIVLAIGYSTQKLKENPDDSMEKELNQIKSKFSTSNYSKLTKEVIDFCKKYKSHINPEVTASLEKKVSQLKDNPDENHNRRFFETRLSEHFIDEIKGNRSYESVSALNNVMKTQSFLVYALPPNIESFEDAETVISYVASLNEDLDGFKRSSENYPKKDRQKKSEEKTYSRNLGIMKETTPNFVDLINDEDLKDKEVDAFKVDVNQKLGFSSTNKEIPFANSLSGTTFTLVSLLDLVIKSNSKEEKLEEDVNNIIQMVIALFIKKGYHSMGEMQEVLKEPHIHKIFEEAGVKINSNIPLSVINRTFEEAEVYTLNTCLKKALSVELKSKHKEIPGEYPTERIIESAKKAKIAKPEKNT